MPYDFSILSRLRKEHKMTITELCERTDLSYLTIAGLERNQANPRFRTLVRICEVLQIPVHELLTLAEMKRPKRAKETDCEFLKEGHCRGVNLRGTRIYSASAPKGACGAQPESHEGDYEHCYVLRGKLRIHIHDSVYTLKAGQAISWDCAFEHNYHALEDSEWIAVLTPKRL